MMIKAYIFSGWDFSHLNGRMIEKQQATDTPYEKP